MMHPDREALVAEMTGEPSNAEVREHLASCPECQESADALRQEWRAYLRVHGGVLKEMLPEPPRPWADLRPRMVSAPRKPILQWLAIAAAMTLAVLAGWQYLRQPPTVSAAALLVKAVAAAPAPVKARRIVVRSTKRTLVRAAVETAVPDSEMELRAQFVAANYGWDEPLSAKAFQAWHDSLESATDRVDQIPAGEAGGDALYRISTSTTTGTIHHATLSLRQADLAPVLTRLEFPGETVEISPVPDSAPLSGAKLPAAAAPALEPTLVNATDELRVVAALHALGADLGEPVVVERTAEAIRVSAVGISRDRAAQIQTALASFPFVAVDVADVRPSAPLPGASANPTADRILALSDAVMARAFAIRGLETRFPASGVAAMMPADRESLRSIFADHAQGFEKSLTELTAVLQPKLPVIAAEQEPAKDASPERLLEAARGLDQALNRAFASSGDGRIDGVAEALAQVRAAVVAHRSHWSAQR